MFDVIFQVKLVVKMKERIKMILKYNADFDCSRRDKYKMRNNEF